VKNFRKKLVKRKKEKVLFKQDMLREALKDLNSELKTLRSSKKSYETKGTNLSESLTNAQNKEVQLRTIISRLMKQESSLVKRKTKTKDKIAELDKKIEKIKAIERDLKGV